jgi:hypothetical protein
MNLPLPDVKGMSDREFIMWICGAVLLYLLWVNPLALETKMKEIAVVQAQMLQEHQDLLAMGRVQCVNFAELVPEKEVRARHLNRCLTLQVEAVKG